jgi:hypothetical protein
MLFAYGDESMDESCQRVCAVAGVIAPQEEWERIEPLWLERNHGIPFHAKDCENGRGDYDHARHKENLELYRDLVVLVADSKLCGFAAVADLEAERRFYPNLPMLYLREFSLVIEAMCFNARQEADVVKMCFDGRQQSDHNAGLLYGQMMEQFPEWRPHLAETIEFDYSATNARKQVADLFAREAMKLLDNRIGPQKHAPRKSWIALRDTGRFEIREFDEQFFAEEKRLWDSTLSRSGERFAEYMRWLRRRQHNLSNTIQFVGKNPSV